MSQSADRVRFDHLYTDNLPLILGYAVRRCAQPSDAADVAAEVFLTLWRRLDDVPPGDERLWLFGVARKVLANHRRGHARRSELADHLRMELATVRPAGGVDEGTVAVTQAMAQLPAADRELLALSVWDGLTPTEIARLERVPPATVRSRLLRARARLRVLLHDEPGVPTFVPHSTPAPAPTPTPTLRTASHDG